MRMIVGYILSILVFCIPQYAQDIALIISNDTRSDTLQMDISKVEYHLSTQLEYLRDSGFWDARIELTAPDSLESCLEASIISGDPTAIKHFHFANLSARDEHYLWREFTMGASSLAAINVNRAEDRITTLGYRLSDPGVISRDTYNQFHLNYSVMKSPELSGEVLASFNQNAKADTVSWYGHINIFAPNIDGNGKSLAISWKRLRANSESFDFSYKHPWLFQLPMQASVGFSREVVDGNYQLLERSLGLDWRLDWEKALIFSYENDQSIITLEGALLNPEWVSRNTQMLGLGYKHSSLRREQHTGYALKTALFQELNFEPNSIRKFMLRSELEVPLIKSLYFSQRNSGVVQNAGGVDDDPSVLVALGGINTVRGYEENIRRAPSILSIQNNIHLDLGSQSQVLTFLDLGFYTDGNGIKSIRGYGIGFRLQSKRGPLRIILASHPGVALRNSFLHIEYSGGVPWIDR